MKSNSLTYLCPENEFKKIIMDSTSFQEVARKLGYKSYSGGTAKLLKKRGAEMNSLMGAKKQIQQNRPKLAICIYHRLQDLWEIPMYIKSLVPEYKFYVRHHTTSIGDTVLYAVC